MYPAEQMSQLSAAARPVQPQPWQSDALDERSLSSNALTQPGPGLAKPCRRMFVFRLNLSAFGPSFYRMDTFLQWAIVPPGVQTNCRTVISFSVLTDQAGISIVRDSMKDSRTRRYQPG